MVKKNTLSFSKVTTVLLFLCVLPTQAFLEEPYKTVACRACLTENDNSHYCYRLDRPFVSCCPAESFTMDCLAITTFDQMCSEKRAEPTQFKLEMLANCPIFEDESECGTLLIELDYLKPVVTQEISNAYPDEKFCNYDFKVQNMYGADQYTVDIYVVSEDVVAVLVVGDKPISMEGIALTQFDQLKTNLVISAQEFDYLSYKLVVNVKFTLKSLYDTILIVVGVLLLFLSVTFLLLCLQVHGKVDLRQWINPNSQTQAEVDEDKLRDTLNEEMGKASEQWIKASGQKKKEGAGISQTDDFFGVDDWVVFDDPNSKLDFQKFQQQALPDYTREIMDGLKPSKSNLPSTGGPVIAIGSPSNSQVLTSCEADNIKKSQMQQQSSKQSISKVQPGSAQEISNNDNNLKVSVNKSSTRQNLSQQNVQQRGGAQVVTGFKDQQPPAPQGGFTGANQKKHVDVSLENLDEYKLAKQIQRDAVGDTSPLRTSCTQVAGGGFKDMANKLQLGDKDFDKQSIQSHQMDLNPSRAKKGGGSGADEGGQQSDNETSQVGRVENRAKSALKTQKSIGSKAGAVKFALGDEVSDMGDE